MKVHICEKDIKASDFPAGYVNLTNEVGTIDGMKKSYISSKSGRKQKEELR